MLTGNKCIKSSLFFSVLDHGQCAPPQLITLPSSQVNFDFVRTSCMHFELLHLNFKPPPFLIPFATNFFYFFPSQTSRWSSRCLPQFLSSSWYSFIFGAEAALLMRMLKVRRNTWNVDWNLMKFNEHFNLELKFNLDSSWNDPSFFY